MTTLPNASSPTQELVTLVRKDGTMEYQSPTVTEVLGYTPTDLQDEKFLSFVHPDDRDRVRDLLEGLFGDTGPRTQQMEYRFRRKGRSWGWINSLGTRRQDIVVLNSQNVTRKKHKRQQVTVLHRILRHNLRNELSAIMGRAEMLTEIDDPDQVRRSAEKIKECASRLNDLAENTQIIDDLPDGSPTHQEPQDPAPILSELVNELRDEYPAVEFDVAFLDTQYVPGSPNLDVAFRHVLENAIQHNDSENPLVKVRVSSPATNPSELTVAISDNGPGIPEQEQAVLVEGDETPFQHGSGIGLWIVNWIISNCGGRIEFDRSQFGGSRVRLIFPVSPR